MDNATLQNEIIDRLIRDFGFIEQNGWLRGGRCPECGKKEIYTNIDNPWKLKCPRENKCNDGNPWEADIKDLYPDLFEKFNERYKSTPDNPNAIADAYMVISRGLDVQKIRGTYVQGRYKNPSANKETATVRFYVDVEKEIYMERFVESVYVTENNGDVKERKQRFHNSHQGQAWNPPGQEIKSGDEVFITEACIDALSLVSNGFKAVASLSSNNFPKFFFERYPKDVKWVWALDNDKAGVKWIRSHVKSMREKGYKVRAALPKPGAKEDWNDLHKKNLISKHQMNEYFYQGDLVIAKSAEDKALTMWREKGINNFHLDFDNCWHWFSLDIDKHIKTMEKEYPDLPEKERRMKAAEKSFTVSLLAKCKITFLYYQVAMVGDEGFYYARIEFPNKQKPIKHTFTGGQITATSKFKERLASIAPGCIFTGKGYQLDKICIQETFGLDRVETVDYVGYSKEHETYIFNDLAIHDGKLYSVNDDDFFNVKKHKVKAVDHGVALSINQNKSDYSEAWLDYLWCSHGAKGYVALIYWFGSLFAEQIRESQSSYPFLQFVGQAGTGKSTVLEFLWRLVGREGWEGIDPNKSSISARARVMGQVANLPCVFIEGDRETDESSRVHVKQVNWDEFKTAYNGRATHYRGTKTHGNQTYEPPFRAALVISQNNEIIASEAIQTRIVNIYLTREGHSLDTREAAEKLTKTTVEELSYFLIKSCLAEKVVMKTVNERARIYREEILAMTKVRIARIAECHGQLLALTDAFSKLFGLANERVDTIKTEIRSMAVKRQEACGKDHTVVHEFWEAIEFLEPRCLNKWERSLNHSKSEGLIAINLNEFAEAAAEFKQKVPALTELRKVLPASKIRKYKTYKSVASRSLGKTVRCYIFEPFEGDCLV